MRWPFKRSNAGLADKVPDGGLRRFLETPKPPRDTAVTEIPLLGIDFETTGLTPDMGDRTTEIAAVLIRDGRIVDRHRPMPKWRRI